MENEHEEVDAGKRDLSSGTSEGTDEQGNVCQRRRTPSWQGQATATQDNGQPAERRVRDESGVLEIVKVWKTIQGEGPFVGESAIFVRLAGCNLVCPRCDTNYTSTRQQYDPYGLLSVINARRSERGYSRPRLVVLTGGEPFRQNILPLLKLLTEVRLKVQIETNGTLCQVIPPTWGVSVVCSPKTSFVALPFQNPGFTTAFKYVVEADRVDPSDGLPNYVLGKQCRVYRPDLFAFDRHKIYVQPQDDQDPEKNKANIQQAVDVCMKFGYRLCLQTHKIAGLE